MKSGNERTINVSNECVNSSEQSTTYYYLFIIYLLYNCLHRKQKAVAADVKGGHHRFALLERVCFERRQLKSSHLFPLPSTILTTRL